MHGMQYIFNIIVFFTSIFMTSCAGNNSIPYILNYKGVVDCVAKSYCDNNEPCSENGNCYVNIFSYYNITNTNRNTTCICNKGWISLDDSNIMCCYNQKQQAIAFLLEFVVGFGVGHWYVGNKLRAVIKMIFSILLCVIICVTSFIILFKKGDYEIISENKKRKGGKVSVLLMLGSIFGFFFWQFLDAILFGVNYYLDGNGQKLQDW